MTRELSPEDVLYAYRMGYFPMADSFDGKIYWHSPDPRAVFPFNRLKMPRSVAKFIQQESINFTINNCFDKVILACSQRDETWISKEIIYLYNEIHRMGFAHSIETWHEDKLVGGLYGVSINGAFFGESMFNSIPNASKAAFYYLVEILRKRGFLLLDSQYLNDHTSLLGAIEISKADYMALLDRALKIPVKFID